MMPSALQETVLWKRLKDGFSGEDRDFAEKLAAQTETLAAEASEIMKRNMVLHKEFTLHDEVHLFRVAEIAAMILGEDGLAVLNPLETALLLLASYFHDIGMAPGDVEIERIKADPAYQIFVETWLGDHPNYRECRTQLNSAEYDTAVKERSGEVISQLRAAVLTEYIRTRHGENAKILISEMYGQDQRWEVSGVNISSYVGKLAVSHTMDISNIDALHGYLYDERIGCYDVNMVYLAVILRLADILDFDRERTPDVLYQAMNFSNRVSLTEWEKHRSISGWEISRHRIRFTAACIHPIYQKTILRFMDWIDEELAGCHECVNRFPASFQKYRLELPMKTDRSRIAAKDGSYIYYDLEFSISRDEIVSLLMMDGLYGSKSLCIRELLQNALDALRYRKKLFEKDNIRWEDGKVEFRHYVDEYGREHVSCTDNGIGMDEHVVTRFLTRVGRSFYKSPEFYKEQAEMKRKGIVFNPCSQFGIGFMSCFMLGNSIVIHTRKDYGHGKKAGRPLEVEISGLNGLIVIREGQEDQPAGTCVDITGREKPRYLDWWNDDVRLLDVLEGYSLANEFPIHAVCELKEIEGGLDLPAGIEHRKTFLAERLAPEYIRTYEQDFNELNPNLSGTMSLSFLIDDRGRLTLKNGQAEWKKENSGYELRAEKSGGLNRVEHENTAVCCDGILVCGRPGRGAGGRLGHRSDVLYPHMGKAAYVLDIRGEIKPKLTPARTPKSSVGVNRERSWEYIRRFVRSAEGRLWSRLLMDCSSRQEIAVWMKTAGIYRCQFKDLGETAIYSKMLLPVKREDRISWRSLSEVKNITIYMQADPNAEGGIGCGRMLTDSGEIIVSVKSLEDFYEHGAALDQIMSAVWNVSKLGVNAEGKPILYVKSPQELSDTYVHQGFYQSFFYVSLAEYTEDAQKYIAVYTGYFLNLNRDHPLVKYCSERWYDEKPTDLQIFARAVVSLAAQRGLYREIFGNRRTGNLKRIGCLYEDVSWENYAEELKPDYFLYDPVKGEIRITDEMLREWASWTQETAE